MSMYSGKCDVYDCFSDLTDEQIANSKFFIDDKQIKIKDQKGLIPYYPHIACAYVYNKEKQLVAYMSSRSFVDEENNEFVRMYMNDCKRIYRRYHRKNDCCTVNDILTELKFWGNNRNFKYIAEEVVRHGEKANANNVYLSSLCIKYKKMLLDKMLEAGYSLEEATSWVYFGVRTWD